MSCLWATATRATFCAQKKAGFSTVFLAKKGEPKGKFDFRITEFRELGGMAGVL